MQPMNKEVSGTTERIFTKLSRLVELCKHLINPALIWRSLKGSCHGNQFKTQNRRFWRTNLHCRAAILKQIGLSEVGTKPHQICTRGIVPSRNADEKRIGCGYTSCTNLVRFGSVTPEFRLLIFILV